MPIPTLRFTPHTLYFKQPAGTSRGVYRERMVWYLVLSDGIKQGIGECAPLPDLSCDYEAVQEWMSHPMHLEVLLQSLLEDLDNSRSEASLAVIPENMPSLRFAVETAYLHFRSGSLCFWDTSFSRAEKGIPINGLIWMGTHQEMYHRIREKTEAGYRCIKLKIGGINFEEELDLLRYIRRHFSAQNIELRVDANGAFTPKEAPERLQRLAELDLHSIEQPIRAGQWKALAELCHTSPLPIALDEELIGIHTVENKQVLLDTLHPKYIVLKPSLHGGMQGCREWIREAEQRQIGWWATSALESNIGLNAIAQSCACFSLSLPQGLGTGQLFTHNIPSPLYLKGDTLWMGSGHELPPPASWITLPE